MTSYSCTPCNLFTTSAHLFLVPYSFSSDQCALFPSPLSFSSNRCTIFTSPLLFSHDWYTKFPSGSLFIIASTCQNFCPFYPVHVYLWLPHVPPIVMAFFFTSWFISPLTSSMQPPPISTYIHPSSMSLQVTNT